MIPCDFITSSNYTASTVFSKKVLAASVAFCSFTPCEISGISFLKAQNNLHFKSSVDLCNNQGSSVTRFSNPLFSSAKTLHWYHDVKAFSSCFECAEERQHAIFNLYHNQTNKHLHDTLCLLSDVWQSSITDRLFSNALCILTECHFALSPSSLTFKSSADLISQNMLSVFAPQHLRSLILKNKHKQIIWSLPEPLR